MTGGGEGEIITIREKNSNTTVRCNNQSFRNERSTSYTYVRVRRVGRSLLGRSKCLVGTRDFCTSPTFSRPERGAGRVKSFTTCSASGPFGIFRSRSYLFVYFLLFAPVRCDVITSFCVARERVTVVIMRLNGSRRRRRERVQAP